MTEKIKVNDIVTVISKKALYHERQGQVIEIENDGNPDGPIGVKFDRDQLFHYAATEEDCIVRHKARELRVEKNWNAKTRARRTYGRNYHTLQSFTFEFSDRNPCMHEDCMENAARRCMINIHGCVCEVDLCTTHAEKFDAYMMDAFPWKKGWKAVDPPEPNQKVA